MRGNFDVAPRYTAGSPAMVEADQAMRVVLEEWDGWEAAAEGVYGEERQKQAHADSLAGIVRYYKDYKKGLVYLDLITGDMWHVTWDKRGDKQQARLQGDARWKFEGELEWARAQMWTAERVRRGRARGVA